MAAKANGEFFFGSAELETEPFLAVAVEAGQLPVF